MSDPFRQEYRAEWRDMDFNQHMGNAVFLEYASNTRFLFFESAGFTAADFAARRLGPVILEDRLVYRREIRMLERFTVDFQLVSGTADGRRFKVRNRFVTEAQGLCATVDSVGVWFDLAARAPIVPPDDLHRAFSQLERSEDFEEWD